MEDLPDALAKLPELAPGMVIGTIAGLVYGIVQDVRRDELGNFWSAGGLGFVAGAVGWWILIGRS